MLPGNGFSIASCSAYITMKGVMMPGVSAGSNQVGASDICTPQVSWLCGAAEPASGPPGVIRTAHHGALA